MVSAAASATEPEQPGEPPELVVISGMSGAGRSTAAKVLEDLGWFVVDNLPPSLIPTMVDLAARSVTLPLVGRVGRRPRLSATHFQPTTLMCWPTKPAMRAKLSPIFDRSGEWPACRGPSK